MEQLPSYNNALLDEGRFSTTVPLLLLVNWDYIKSELKTQD